MSDTKKLNWLQNKLAAHWHCTHLKSFHECARAFDDIFKILGQFTDTDTQYTPLEVLFDDILAVVSDHYWIEGEPGVEEVHLTPEGEAKLRELLAVYTAKMRKAIAPKVIIRQIEEWYEKNGFGSWQPIGITDLRRFLIEIGVEVKT